MFSQGAREKEEKWASFSSDSLSLMGETENDTI